MTAVKTAAKRQPSRLPTRPVVTVVVALGLVVFIRRIAAYGPLGR